VGQPFERPSLSALGSVQLGWPEGAGAHGAGNRFEQVAVVQSAPERRLVEAVAEYCLAAGLKLAERELLGQESEREVKCPDLFPRRGHGV
jgi:hypothetical protein